MNGRMREAIIVGGGPIGCAAAIALSDAGLDVVVLEAHAGDQRAPDARTLALSWNSRLVLERLHAWSACLPATSIETIHVSHRGRFGRAELKASDIHLPALGYVLRHADVHQALRERVLATEVEYLDGFAVADIDIGEDAVEVSGTTPSGKQSVQARLVIVADGGASLTKSVSVEIRDHDYEQAAVVGLVRSDRPHRHRAYERFTPAGPIALLPSADEFAFVWSCKPELAPLLLTMDDDLFVKKLQLSFGDRAGRFVGLRQRAMFPLVLRVMQERASARLVLLGNAAQSLHPIAGQGFNLGLRDVWDLAEIIRSRNGQDIGNRAMTTLYRRQRRIDRAGGIALTDSLAKLFSTDFAPLAVGRGIGLALLDMLPPVKRGIMHHMIFGVGN
jgi:2-octaprenyl-6-methoxyphenol hydroxylase